MESLTSTRVTIFGKIPTYGDYLQMNCGGSVWHAFDKWFQSGVAGLRRELGAEFKPVMGASTPFHFLFTARDAGGVISGVVYPSSDRVGRFSFLIVATVRPIGANPSTIAHLPAQLRAFYRDASLLASDAVGGRLTKEDVAEQAVRLPNSLDPALGFDGAADPGRAVSSELTEMLGGLRPDQIARFKLAFRLPLVETDLEGSIGDWLRLCVSMVGAPDETSPCAFWVNQASGSATVILSISEPSPNILLSVTAQSVDLDEVMDLAESDY